MIGCVRMRTSEYMGRGKIELLDLEEDQSGYLYCRCTERGYAISWRERQKKTGNMAR